MLKGLISKKNVKYFREIFFENGIKRLLHNTKTSHANFSQYKAELPQVGIFFRTQFPFLGIFINKNVGN